MLSIRRRQMREPDLVDFIELVKDETFLVNDPIFSKSAIDQYCEKPSKGSQQNPKHKRSKLTTYVTMADSCKQQAFNCVWLARRNILWTNVNQSWRSLEMRGSKY